MKITLLALFLVVAFTSAKASVLLDVEGNPVRNGGSYYILPALSGRHGGISIAATGDETCPLTVVQTRSEQSNGMPTKLSSPYRVAYLHANLDIELSVVPPPKCAAQPAKWTIVGREEENRQVKLVGYEDTLSGSFRIQIHQSLTYKIVFCPTGEDSCRALGISKDNKGHRILVINDDNPLVVALRKAKSSSA